MDMKPKTTRENIFYPCMDTYQESKIYHTYIKDVEKLGGKIDKFYWVLLTVAGTAVVFMLERIFT